MTACTLDALRDQLRPMTITSEISRTIDAAIHAAMARLHVIKVRPRWKYWLLAFRAILSPPSLQLDPASWIEATDHSMELVICDGFADGFWPERWAEEARGTRKRASGAIRSAEDIGLKEVMEVIERLRRELGAIIVLSIQGLWVRSHTQGFLQAFHESGLLRNSSVKRILIILHSTSPSAIPSSLCSPAIQQPTRESHRGVKRHCALAAHYPDHLDGTSAATADPGGYNPGRRNKVARGGWYVKWGT